MACNSTFSPYIEIRFRFPYIEEPWWNSGFRADFFFPRDVKHVVFLVPVEPLAVHIDSDSGKDDSRVENKLIVGFRFLLFSVRRSTRNFWGNLSRSA